MQGLLPAALGALAAFDASRSDDNSSSEVGGWKTRQTSLSQSDPVMSRGSGQPSSGPSPSGSGRAARVGWVLLHWRVHLFRARIRCGALWAILYIGYYTQVPVLKTV